MPFLPAMLMTSSTLTHTHTQRLRQRLYRCDQSCLSSHWKRPSVLIKCSLFFLFAFVFISASLRWETHSGQHLQYTQTPTKQGRALPWQTFMSVFCLLLNLFPVSLNIITTEYVMRRNHSSYFPDPITSCELSSCYVGIMKVKVRSETQGGLFNHRISGCRLLSMKARKAWM